jgi:hypothetical protein
MHSCERWEGREILDLGVPTSGSPDKGSLMGGRGVITVHWLRPLLGMLIKDECASLTGCVAAMSIGRSLQTRYGALGRTSTVCRVMLALLLSQTNNQHCSCIHSHQSCAQACVVPDYHQTEACKTWCTLSPAMLSDVCGVILMSTARAGVDSMRCLIGLRIMKWLQLTCCSSC